MTNTPLKPCPFCGGKAEIERKGSTRQSTVYACTDCGCRKETGEVNHLGNLWNTRHVPEITDDDVERARIARADEINRQVQREDDDVHIDWGKSMRAALETFVRNSS